MIKSISKYFTIVTILIVSFNLLLGSLPILNGDILFSSDIARDFLLFEEIDEKKIILIGPRASGLQGLFHGPLWLYLNYPAYLIGNGNPIYVGYFWIFLSILFVISSYFLVKELFTNQIAKFFIILISSILVFYLYGLFNPHGVMFVLPVFLYSLYKYTERLKLRYLILHILALGAMIQFQMAIGIPFAILSFLLVTYIVVKNKKIPHIFSYLLMLIPLSTFIAFDLRHDFAQLNSILRSFTSDRLSVNTPYSDRLNNRWESMTGNLYLVHGNYAVFLNGLISLILTFYLYKRFRQFLIKKNDKYTPIVILLLYFYIGFYLISILFNGNLLTHYTFPLIPLIFLLFCSAYLYLNKKIFICIFILILILNAFTGVSFITSTLESKGASQNSWHFQKEVALKVFNEPENDIGYFIYTPDYYGYSPKYAFSYLRKITPNKNILINEKMEITYLVIEPPPQNRPDIDPNFWKKEKMKISSKPTKIYKYLNGFKIERYELTKVEIETPLDPSVTDWIHFR